MPITAARCLYAHNYTQIIQPLSLNEDPCQRLSRPPPGETRFVWEHCCYETYLFKEELFTLDEVQQVVQVMSPASCCVKVTSCWLHMINSLMMSAGLC